MTIIERVRQAGLPLDECVVIGSGILDALGLRQASDVDLVVTQRLFDELRQSSEYIYSQRYGSDVLDKNDQEICLRWGMGSDTYDYSQLIDHSVVVDGVRFTSPEFVLAWKRFMDRPKDKPDIRLLEEYLQNNAKIG